MLAAKISIFCVAYTSAEKSCLCLIVKRMGSLNLSNVQSLNHQGTFYSSFSYNKWVIDVLQKFQQINLVVGRGRHVYY